MKERGDHQTMKDNDKNNAKIYTDYDRLSHPYCGTDKCCGECKSASISLEALEIKRDHLDKEFEDHCKNFFKGENKEK